MLFLRIIVHINLWIVRESQKVIFVFAFFHALIICFPCLIFLVLSLPVLIPVLLIGGFLAITVPIFAVPYAIFGASFVFVLLALCGGIVWYTNKKN